MLGDVGLFRKIRHIRVNGNMNGYRKVAEYRKQIIEEPLMEMYTGREETQKRESERRNYNGG